MSQVDVNIGFNTKNEKYVVVRIWEVIIIGCSTSWAPLHVSRRKIVKKYQNINLFKG